MFLGKRLEKFLEKCWEKFLEKCWEKFLEKCWEMCLEKFLAKQSLGVCWKKCFGLWPKSLPRAVRQIM
jgi:hypothetical protein